jgi:hypothetical protein
VVVTPTTPKGKNGRVRALPSDNTLMVHFCSKNNPVLKIILTVEPRETMMRRGESVTISSFG